MDHLGYLNSSLYFYFVTNLEKKFYGVLTLTAKSPPSPLLTGPPPLQVNILYGWPLVYFWRYCIFMPLFSLMILVRNFILIKNDIEIWVWKLTEIKFWKILNNHHSSTMLKMFQMPVSFSHTNCAMQTWFSYSKKRRKKHSFALLSNRSSRLQMFYKIGVHKIFAISTGKHLCWSFYLIKLQSFRPATLLKRDCYTGVFLWIFKHFKNIFFYRTHLLATSEQTKKHVLVLDQRCTKKNSIYLLQII